MITIHSIKQQHPNLVIECECSWPEVQSGLNMMVVHSIALSRIGKLSMADMRAHWKRAFPNEDNRTAEVIFNVPELRNL